MHSVHIATDDPVAWCVRLNGSRTCSGWRLANTMHILLDRCSDVPTANGVDTGRETVTIVKYRHVALLAFDAAFTRLLWHLVLAQLQAEFIL